MQSDLENALVICNVYCGCCNLYYVSTGSLNSSYNIAKGLRRWSVVKIVRRNNDFEVIRLLFINGIGEVMSNLQRLGIRK